MFDAAARHGVIRRVFDGDVGPREALIDLAQRATHVVFSQPGLAHATGHRPPRARAWPRSRDPSAGIVGVTLGADGFLWRERGWSAGRARPK